VRTSAAKGGNRQSRNVRHALHRQHTTPNCCSAQNFEGDGENREQGHPRATAPVVLGGTPTPPRSFSRTGPSPPSVAYLSPLYAHLSALRHLT